MSFEQPIRLFREGQGSVTYGTPPGSGGGGAPPGFINVAGARNGLSIAPGGFVVLGQDIGALGDPAKLLSNREIPMNSNYLDMIYVGAGFAGFGRRDPAAGLQSNISTRQGNTNDLPLEIFTEQGFAFSGVQPYGNFAISLDQTFINPDGQADATLSIGYNSNGNSKINNNEAMFAMTLESHFQQGGIGPGQMEYYWEGISKDGTVNRYLFMPILKSNGQAAQTWTTDQAAWFTTAAIGNQQYMQVNPQTGLSLFAHGTEFGLSIAPANAAADGGIIIASLPVSGGITQFEDASTAANSHFDFLASCRFQSTKLVDADGVYQFQVAGPVDSTPEFCILNALTGGRQFTVYGNDNMSVKGKSTFGFGGDADDAWVRIQPGTTTIPPLRLFPSGGIVLAVPLDGVMEYDGTNLFFTVGAVRKTVTLI